MASKSEQGGLEALHRLKSIESPQWLTKSPQLSEAARTASQYLFSSLQPFCPKSPFDRLLVQGFDAEQIWQQIDLQTQPLVSHLHRDLKRFQKNPKEISKAFTVKKTSKEKIEPIEEEEDGEENFESMEDEEIGGFDEEEDDDDEEEKEEEEEVGGGRGGIEDKFLKIKELEEYMEEDEEREYGGGKDKEKKKKKKSVEDEDDQEEEEDENEDEDEGDEIEGLDDVDEDEMETARYEDFFGGNKKKVKSSKMEMKSHDASDDMEDMDDEQVHDQHVDNQKSGNLSTHEKEQMKQRAKVEEMEKLNLAPKEWTMEGEVDAYRRPKNSALEVDLDFDHNVRPAPVITEEVTASLEEIIKKRILEGHFNDVQKAPSLPSRTPKAVKEMDENKSTKGIAQEYEEDYMQKAGLVSAPLSFSDEQKKEASMLFKQLCMKLDALSHFHFTPKPLIEDMSIQTNVPALVIEEVAPVAVSDAAMLAPEEVFAGKGDIKEEAELTQEERKRRRANKKRKYKAESARRSEKRSQDNKSINHSNDKEEA